MPTEAEIKATHKQLHDDLSDSYYQQGAISKADFDQQHGQIWEDMKADLIAEGYLALPNPPKSTHLATLLSVDTLASKPATVRRIWQGNDYDYDCYITENIRDQYTQGDIQVGDTLLVEFLTGEDITPIIVGKVRV